MSIREIFQTTLRAGVIPLILALALVGCGRDDPDVVVIGADEPVQIRTLLSLTGASSSGEAVRASVEMAAADFHRVHGHEISLGPSLDSECSPDGGRAGAELIVADRQVLGVIGTSCSAAAVAASPVISSAGLVMISPSNTSPVLTSDLRGNEGSDYHPGYFRTSNNDIYQGRALANFVYDELGLRRVATMHDGDPYTTALAAAFGSAFNERGGEVPAIGEVEKGQSDMTEVVSEFSNVGVDGIFFPVFPREAAHFVMQVREHEGLEGVALITGDGAIDPAFLALPQSEGVYFAGPELHVGSYSNQATGRTAAEALAAFEAMHGELAHESPYWAHAYDATTLLLAAIQRAANAYDGNFFTSLFGFGESGELHLDRGELREAVRAVSSDFSGLTGSLSCDRFGDCAQGIQVIYHHTDSNVTYPGQVSVVHRVTP